MTAAIGLAIDSARTASVVHRLRNSFGGRDLAVRFVQIAGASIAAVPRDVRHPTLEILWYGPDHRFIGWRLLGCSEDIGAVRTEWQRRVEAPAESLCLGSSGHSWDEPCAPAPWDFHPREAFELLVDWFDPDRVLLDPTEVPPRSRLVRLERTAATTPRHSRKVELCATRNLVTSAARPAIPPASTRLVLSLAPNVDGSENGHFLSFERRLRSEVLDAGFGFLSLAHVDASGLAERAAWIAPCLEQKSVASHVTDSAAAQSFSESTGSKVGAVLEQAQDRFASIHLFHYLGSLDHLPMFTTLIQRHRSVTAHLHLFWEFLRPLEEGSSRRHVDGLLQEVRATDRLAVSVGTGRLREAFLGAVGEPLDLELLPDGPSGVIDDRDAEALMTDWSRVPFPMSQRRVVFPSSASPGKNWELSARTALELARGGRVDDVVIRCQAIPRSQRGRGLLQELIDEPSVSIAWGPMQPDRLIALLASATVAVLPYSPSWFRARTSGLVTEAAIVGARVVCFADTHLADVVSIVGEGEAIPETDSASVIAQAVLRQVARHGERGPTSAASRRRWWGQSNWKTYFETAMTPSGAIDAG